MLYPIQGKQVNHGLLAGAVRPYEVGPRSFRRFTEEEHNARVTSFLQHLTNQVSAQKFELLILSSEYLWPIGTRKAWLEKLRILLAQIGSQNVEFVAYVRRPSSYYLSSIQQRLRASSKFSNPHEYKVANTLDGFSEVFSDSKISARVFDREALVGGDIITDFMSVYRPDLQRIVTTAAEKVTSTNETLSAEGMVVMQQFRRHFYPKQDDRFNRPTSKFVRQLRSVEKKLDSPRPKLRPEIAEYTDYAGTGSLELRDRYGIVFPKLDYSRLERGEFATKPQVGGAVQDVVQVDEDRLEQIVHTLLQNRFMFNPDLKKWLKSLPQAKTAPSAFSLALQSFQKIGK